MRAPGRRTPRARALALVLALLALLAPACSDGGTYEVVAVFDDVGDLQSRGMVQVADVRVGTIGRIELTEDFTARVTLTVNDDVRVPRSSKAILRQTSLLGEKFVELRPVGDPTARPLLADGDVIAVTEEAPEIEFVAQSAVEVLGAVAADDIATLVETGAQGFGERGAELRSIVEDLSTFSRTLAAGSGDLGRIIDRLDAATGTLAAGKDDLARVLDELTATSTILVDNRQRTIDALDRLARLADVQGDVLHRYRADIDRQIGQLDSITAAAAGSQAEVARLLEWLGRFTTNIPKAIPNDFTQVYMWVVPAEQDPRVDH